MYHHVEKNMYTTFSSTDSTPEQPLMLDPQWKGLKITTEIAFQCKMHVVAVVVMKKKVKCSFLFAVKSNWPNSYAYKLKDLFAKIVLHQNNYVCWKLAKKNNFGLIYFFKCLFHVEMLGVTNFWVMPGLCIVQVMIFINKHFVNLFMISICE